MDTGAATPAPRADTSLEARLAAGTDSVVIELVPWRGALDDAAGNRARALAAELAGDPRIAAVSITDGAGGHAMLSPEVLAAELAGRGQESIVHVACRDRNRNELLSLGWRLAGAGLRNVLALSGDYPVEGYRGVARPVFDLDAVGLLALYADMNRGATSREVVGRPILRDHASDVPALAPVRSSARGGGATSLHLGAVVNPFKRLERELLPQYLKLELKVRAGARYAITQVGYDARKLDELRRYLVLRGIAIPVLANVFVLGRGAARVMHAGEVPGCTVTEALLEVVERAAASPDKGRAFFLELAARQVAIARWLGYAGAYLGGSTRADDYNRILELAAAYSLDDGPALARDLRYAPPGSFYYFEDDPAGALNADLPRERPRPRRGLLGAVPPAYRMDRAVHRVAFAPGSAGFRLAAHAYRGLERFRLGHGVHVAEQAIKIPMFDCRDCGDCSLPEIAYLCPESQCAKNQRNGPCGGSRDGQCEVPGKACMWARAYERLKPYHEELTLLDRPVAVPDNALRRTSAWANTYLGRDHVTRVKVASGEEPG